MRRDSVTGAPAGRGVMVTSALAMPMPSCPRTRPSTDTSESAPVDVAAGTGACAHADATPMSSDAAAGANGLSERPAVDGKRIVSLHVGRAIPFMVQMRHTARQGILHALVPERARLVP